MTTITDPAYEALRTWSANVHASFRTDVTEKVNQRLSIVTFKPTWRFWAENNDEAFMTLTGAFWAPDASGGRFTLEPSAPVASFLNLQPTRLTADVIEVNSTLTVAWSTAFHMTDPDDDEVLVFQLELLIASSDQHECHEFLRLNGKRAQEPHHIVFTPVLYDQEACDDAG